MSPQRPMLYVTALALAAALSCGLASFPWGARVAFTEERFAPVVSIFAVGDTGAEPSDDGEGQRAVAGALAWLDGRRPVDGLVLLGDNFYPGGLERIDLVDRLIRNLVDPYCGFVAAGGPRWAELYSDCPGTRTPARPIWAVLGNHDHYGPESADLQRKRVPEFVSNWHMPRESVASIALAGGLQLILVDTVELIKDQTFDLLTQVIANAPGPWRILVSHEPFLAGASDSHSRIGMDRARRAIAAAGVPVQLALAGHEHNLQIIAPPPPGPALQVIAGGGSSPRSVRTAHEGRLFARKAHGFARIELFAQPEERLVVTLFEVPGWWRLGAPPASSVASYAVTLEGEVLAVP